ASGPIPLGSARRRRSRILTRYLILAGRIMQDASCARALRHRCDRLDRVRVLGALVGPITQHAGEAQREPAWVPSARLQLVEGDLDDELRANMDDVPVRRDRERSESLGLPCEHLV